MKAIFLLSSMLLLGGCANTDDELFSPTERARKPLDDIHRDAQRNKAMIDYLESKHGIRKAKHKHSPIKYSQQDAV